MLIDVADLEILVDAPGPAFFDWHMSPGGPDKVRPTSRT
jgi:hypothetical protein